jgi:hypothetical protein
MCVPLFSRGVVRAVCCATASAAQLSLTQLPMQSVQRVAVQQRAGVQPLSLGFQTEQQKLSLSTCTHAHRILPLPLPLATFRPPPSGGLAPPPPPPLQSGGSCDHVNCLFSKNLTESLYHPDRYKTKLCTNFLRGKCLYAPIRLVVGCTPPSVWFYDMLHVLQLISRTRLLRYPAAARLVFLQPLTAATQLARSYTTAACACPAASLQSSHWHRRRGVRQ